MNAQLLGLTDQEIKTTPYKSKQHHMKKLLSIFLHLSECYT